MAVYDDDDINDRIVHDVQSCTTHLPYRYNHAPTSKFRLT